MNSDNVLNILWRGVKSKPRKSLPDKTTQVTQGDEVFKVKKEESTSDESDVEEVTHLQSVKVKAEANPEHIVGLRKKNNITVKGKNLPPPLESFDELASVYGVDENIVNNLKSAGYDGPTPIQMQAIPALLKGRQVLACAPTGSGKTVAFLAPVLASLGKPSRKGFRALILSPTRELAKQIFRECTLLSAGTGLKANYITKSKDRAKQLFDELIYDGINVDVIHSDRTQHQRDNVVRAFREGKIWVLICTDIMGRGVDFVGIKLVVNYDFPNSAISYIHRIGRTGRAGMAGRAVTYFTDEDKPALRTIARVMKDSGCPVPEYMLSLKKTSKRDRLKMENTVPDREDISTGAPKLKRFKTNQKLKKNSVQ
ncbi:hypothetical protein GE061_003995 [Apolygus lucorum]|uniref:RNA helicase n=1 Tax=Apolygus lucorum TaxID=248454 RepID=A0A8S9WY49_APOLU|nr:hypothetical protein GE061_003995 [Apolygus lucorum]